MKFNGNIILVGFMASGKSQVGRELAKALGLKFYDTDQLIEQEYGLQVTEIFEKKGEAFFRKAEEAIVNKLARQRHMVLSTGGGLWVKEANRRKLMKTGLCLWLKVRPEVVLKRVRENLRARPVLKKRNSLEGIQELMFLRRPFYSMSDACFDTSSTTPRQAAETIVEYVKTLK